MKKTILLMLGLVAGTASFAQTSSVSPLASSPESIFLTATDQKIKLFIEPKSEAATILMRDQNGHVLYRKTVDLQKGLRQNFDISGLASGAYSLSIVTGKTTVEKPFAIQEKTIEKYITFGS
ncbi:T9SS C-terminal target domain-containing protein [Larkinella sp.]|uniref:T9SS C-terminal target domain-containing protein n=1 Tax=Larkinella sp. TaxID=2034517 RepID=UPI003BA8D14E